MCITCDTTCATYIISSCGMCIAHLSLMNTYLFIIATTVGFWKHIPTRREDPHCATCYQGSQVYIPLHQAGCVPWMCRGGGISSCSPVGYHRCCILLLVHVAHTACHEHGICGVKDAPASVTTANAALFWSLCSMHWSMCPELRPSLSLTKVETGIIVCCLY